jgi:hypothetical protein
MNISKSWLGNPKVLSVQLFGDHEARKRSILQLSPRELDWWTLEQARKLPVPMNARQYFNSTIADSLIVASSVTPTTTETSIFTPYTLCNQAFPVGYGLAAPFAGQVYRFSCGGILTTPATGTLVIKPYYGQGASATSFTNAVLMGASAAQTVTASLASQPWRMEGELIFRSIASGAVASTAWLTGSFESQGTLATAGGGWGIVFGSVAAVSVDTSGIATGGIAACGSLTFSVTFSITGATIVTDWTSMQSLN